MRAHRTPGRASRAGVALATAVFGLVLAGCGSPSQSVARCVGAADEGVRAIETRLTNSGELRNAKTVTVDGSPRTFISAEIHLPSDEPHHKGDIATWAIEDTKGNDYLAVDVVARDESKWPASPFDVTEDGAIESRACTNLSRGKTPAQVACERDLDKREIPLPAGKDCSDL